MDVMQVFLNLKADINIYIKVLSNQEINNKVIKDAPDQACKLLKALYGLKQAPYLWQKELAFALQELEFTPCISN